MDSKIIILTISLFLAIYAMSIISKKDKTELEIENIINPIIEQEPIEIPKEDPKNKVVDIGNVLNKKTYNNDIYTSRKNKIIQETDSIGGFNYSDIQGMIKKNTTWGQDGPKAYNKTSDIQPKYLYGLQRNKNVMYFDKHFVEDSEQPTEDVASSDVQERYKHMNAAFNQLTNATANAYKNNIDLNNQENKKLLTFSKSKILAPSFSFGYLDSKDPISLKSGIPVNKDLPPDVTKGVRKMNDEVKFNNDNKIIYKII